MIKRYFCSSSRFFVHSAVGNAISCAENVIANIGSSGINNIQTGVIICENTKEIVPIVNNVVQTQYKYQLPTATSTGNDYHICGFHGRTTDEDEVWRSIYGKPVFAELVTKLNKSLEKYSYISTSQLLLQDGVLAGSSASRVYRNFISVDPREKILKNYNAITSLSEWLSTEDGDKYLTVLAERTATQIDLLYRQWDADRSNYLRNTDVTLPDQYIGTRSVEALPAPIALILDNIRSGYNVGSIYRSASAAGVTEILTCGITVTPPNPKLMKTALHSCKSIRTTHFDSVMDAVQCLKQRGYSIYALETTSKSISYTSLQYPKSPVALVLGNESTGVCSAVMDTASQIVEIPCYGVKNSLNVSTAMTVVVMEIIRQWNPTHPSAR